MLLFKITNCLRTRKVFVTEDEASETLYNNVVVKASKKLDVNGVQLVLESDGTELDDDSLRLLHQETLVLLEVNEVWKSPGSFLESVASTSTRTVSPNASFSSSSENDVGIPMTNVNTMGSAANSGSVSESVWATLSIPWNKLKAATLKSCEDGMRDPRAIKDVIHLVGDQMMQIKQTVPAKAIKLAASKIILKYPKTFQDVDDDGVILGDGSHTVFSKLKKHIKYMSRSHKRCASNSPSSSPVPLQKKMKMLAAKAGTANWQPPEPENTENTGDETINEMKNKLKNIKSSTDIAEPETLDLLKATYFHQRTFLNNIPTVFEIKEEWPILLTKTGIYWHYKELMGHDVDTLVTKMLSKSERIINFAMKQKLLRLVADSDYQKILCILDMFSIYFGDNINHFYSRVRTEEELETVLGNSPHIVNFEEGNTLNKLYIYFEKLKINVSGVPFGEALQQAYALFFNFNLEYPKKMASTLEMIQRYFLKVHPDVGTKNKKHSSKIKIVNLINKLRN